MSSAVTAAQQAANINTLRRNVLEAMGLPAALAVAAIPLEQLPDFRRRMAEFIVSHPQSFTDESVAQAGLALDHIAKGTQVDRGTYTLMEGVSDFTAEAVRQEERLNPFSEQNGSTTASALIVALIVGVAIYAYFKARGTAAAPLPSPA